MLKYTEIITQIISLMERAEESEINDPNAATLATADKKGRPSLRVVLVKKVDPEDHFVFFTNENSRKGQDLLSNPYAALNFHWKTLGRQIRIEGEVVKIASEEYNAYFATRSRGS